MGLTVLSVMVFLAAHGFVVNPTLTAGIYGLEVLLAAGFIVDRVWLALRARP